MMAARSAGPCAGCRPGCGDHGVSPLVTGTAVTGHGIERREGCIAGIRPVRARRPGPSGVRPAAGSTWPGPTSSRGRRARKRRRLGTRPGPHVAAPATRPHHAAERGSPGARSITSPAQMPIAPVATSCWRTRSAPGPSRAAPGPARPGGAGRRTWTGSAWRRGRTARPGRARGALPRAVGRLVHYFSSAM